MRIFLKPVAAVFLLFAVWTGAATAGPVLLFDAANGKVIYAEDPDNLWHPASLTKVMTAYLVFEALKNESIKLDTKISCSLQANLQPPSKIGLNVGGVLTVDTALKALIVKSANDVAVMLAEAVAGSESAFIEKMNTTAKRLGMSRTTYVNANGLPAAEQITTARDLGKLARAIAVDFPEYAHYWTMTDVRIGTRRLGTHNGLLKTYPGADGMKTGFTCDSGYNVIASATRDGRRLMAVVLGENSGNERTIRAASLLEHGFIHYDWKQFFNSTDLNTMPVAADAKGILSVRDTVSSWDCGGRRPRVRAKRKKTPSEKPAVIDQKAAAPAPEKAS